MTAALTADTVIRMAPAYRLQWEEAQQSYVLLYPEGLVTLNSSAGDILKRCDGNSVEEIVAELRRSYPGANIEADVTEFLEVARDEGWIRFE